jgi:hypothetical protein
MRDRNIRQPCIFAPLVDIVLTPQNPAYRWSGQIFVRRIHPAQEGNIFGRVARGKASPYRRLRTYLPFRTPLPNQTCIWARLNPLTRIGNRRTTPRSFFFSLL